MTTVSLDDLVGTHIIDGVGEYVASRSYAAGGSCEDSARVFLLRVDGRIYAFSEDSSDGYRSMLGTIAVLASGPADERRVVTFKPKTCHFTKRGRRPEIEDTDDYDDVLMVTDGADGKILLEIGTENVMDYYPSFISRWTPGVDTK